MTGDLPVFFVRRLSTSLLVLVIISMILMGVVQLMPGDAVDMMLRGLSPTAVSQETLDAKRRELGLDLPVWLQYWNWMTSLLQGDFGRSFTLNVPVGPMIAGRLKSSLILAVPAFMAIMRLLNVSGGEEISVQRQVQHLFTIVFILIISGGVLALMFETQYTDECTADPRCAEGQMIETVEDAIWWSIETATTVGYGEFAPKSIGARAVATVLLFVGIGLVATLAASLSQLFYSAAHRNDSNGGRGGERLLGQLEMVTELRDKGMLTSDEFDAAKRMLFRTDTSDGPADSLPRALAREKEIRGQDRSQHRSRALQARKALEEVASDFDSE